MLWVPAHVAASDVNIADSTPASLTTKDPYHIKYAL